MYEGIGLLQVSTWNKANSINSNPGPRTNKQTHFGEILFEIKLSSLKDMQLNIFLPKFWTSYPRLQYTQLTCKHWNILWSIA